MNKIKTSDLILGIIGSICFGIGDWLLGYVQTGAIGNGTFYFLQQGHGADYNLGKITAVFVLAAIGVAFLYPGLICLSQFAKEEKHQKLLKFLFAMQVAGYIMLHFIVAFHVLAFSADCKTEGMEAAIVSAKILNDCITPTFLLSYVFIFAGLIVLPILILANKTTLPKAAAFVTPVVPMCVIWGVAALLPASALSYGMFTFCINFGMLVWYFCLLIRQKTTGNGSKQ